MINYVKGSALNPIGNSKSFKYIVHICNNKGGWGKGFVNAISKEWKCPEYAYRELAKNNNNDIPLGKIQIVRVEPNVFIVNMIAQNGYKSILNPVPVDYNALEKCLSVLSKHFTTHKSKDIINTVHMPRIGCGLGGGDWNVIEKIIEQAFNGTEVYVYDFK